MTISPERLAEITAIPDDKIDTSDIPEMSPVRMSKLVKARLFRRLKPYKKVLSGH